MGGDGGGPRRNLPPHPTVLRAASELRLTRIDLPFLLGTAVTADRQRAKLLGYLLHFVAGMLFSLAYYVGFVGLGRSGWLLGSGFGVIHGLFAMTALVNILLPVVHPRMGDALSSVDSAALLEAPGFLMLNYGRATPLVNMISSHRLRRDRRWMRVTRRLTHLRPGRGTKSRCGAGPPGASCDEGCVRQAVGG